MRNHQQPGKTKLNHKKRQSPGGEFDDEGRDPGSGSRDKNPNDEGRFTDERHSGERPQPSSRGPSSKFGDDEIGGTSFDPGPVHSEERASDEQTARARGTAAETKNKK